MAKASAARPLIFITIGLALLDIWCDVLGHGSATVAAADLVGASLTNGRVFWNISLVAFCGAIVLAPRWFTDHHRPWDLAVPAAAALGTVLYALSPSLTPGPALPTACIVLTGVCYGWLEARLFFEAARLEKLAHVVLALAGSRVVKAIAVAGVGALAPAVQIAADALAVVGCGACLIAATTSLAHIEMRPTSTEWRLPVTERAGFIAFVILFPVLNAVGRALSPLGFWSDESIVGGAALPSILPACALFIAVVVAIFHHYDDGGMFPRMAAALLVLLGALLLVDQTTLAELAVPEVVIQSASLSVELLSHFLFWLAGVMAARTLEWPPLRSTAMAELVMSTAAILFSLILQSVSSLGRFIVIAALYGAVAVLMAVVWRTWQAGHEAEAPTPVNDLAEACALIAAERNLSPREAEVLALLAEGRSRTYIMEKLVISDATVKSHTNHIYQKLGVHSKQDLITMVRER